MSLIQMLAIATLPGSKKRGGLLILPRFDRSAVKVDPVKGQTLVATIVSTCYDPGKVAPILPFVIPRYAPDRFGEYGLASPANL